LTSRLLALSACAAAFWLLLALPARFLLGEDDAPVLAGIAALVCLAPCLLAVIWAEWAFSSSPDQQALALLGASGVRMFVTLLAALALYLNVAALKRPAFLLWVAAAYLTLLAAEVALVVTARRQAAQNTGTGA
jgi:hypothetical protein